jgi:hypothetical protein
MRQRRGEIDRARFLHDVEDRHGDPFLLQRRDGHHAVRRDVEVARAPAVDHVQRVRIVDRPVMFAFLLLLRFDELVRRQFLSCAPF